MQIATLRCLHGGCDGRLSLKQVRLHAKVEKMRVDLICDKCGKPYIMFLTRDKTVVVGDMEGYRQNIN